MEQNYLSSKNNRLVSVVEVIALERLSAIFVFVGKKIKSTVNGTIFNRSSYLLIFQKTNMIGFLSLQQSSGLRLKPTADTLRSLQFLQYVALGFVASLRQINVIVGITILSV